MNVRETDREFAKGAQLHFKACQALDECLDGVNVLHHAISRSRHAIRSHDSFALSNIWTLDDLEAAHNNLRDNLAPTDSKVAAEMRDSCIRDLIFRHTEIGASMLAASAHWNLYTRSRTD